jgi:GNAT superfamily N-acetyltransferase
LVRANNIRAEVGAAVRLGNGETPALADSMTAPARWEKDGFAVSTDPALLDREFIVRALQSTYWANERSREDILRSLESPASVNFGLYQNDGFRQIGFARVVTDRITFSWLCDVVVAEGWRGRKLGTWMIACVVSHPCVKYVRTTLGTRDAHGLYEKFGWVRHERMNRPPDPRP